MSTESSRRQLFLAANVANSGGTLPYSWTKSPTAATDPHDRHVWRRIAETLERGKFHALFLGDVPHPLGRADTTVSKLEPTTLLARLAAQTTHLGFATTLSSSLNDPFETARKLYTLQRITGGRFAVNIVTTAQDEPYRNFGIDAAPDRIARYQNAFDFVDELRKQWQALDGIATDHHASPIRLRLLQAGGSPQGVELAGKYADAVYGSASTRDYSAQLRARVRQVAARQGRDPDSVLFVPGINVTLGSTQTEAEDRFERYTGDFDSDTATGQLSALLGVSLAGLHPDRRIPDELLERALADAPLSATSIAHRTSFIRLIREANEPLKDVIRRVDLNGSGHRTFVGSPRQLADHILEWFDSEAADGFIIRPQTVPDDLTAFIDDVVPLLQRAGAFHRNYSKNVFDFTAV